MASNSQFTEMFLEWPLSKIVSEILTCPRIWLWWMGATWLYEHKQIPKKSSLKLLVRFWNNLIEMFLEWPFSELFLKFWSVNKHGISEWRLLALYRHKEILVNSSLKTTRKKWLEQSQKIRWAIQGHLGPLVQKVAVSGALVVHKYILFSGELQSFTVFSCLPTMSSEASLLKSCENMV